MEDKKREKLNKKFEDAAARAGGGDIARIDLVDGVNVVKLISADFEENWAAFAEDTEGVNRKINMGIDKADNRERFPLVYENVDESNISHRYYFEAIGAKIEKNSEGKKVAILGTEKKLFEIGPMIFKQIAAIQQDDEYPDIDEVNLKITRSGKKKNTEYVVLPGRNKTELPEDLVGEIDLESLVKETDEETICEIFGLDYKGESKKDNDDLEDDAPSPKKSKPKPEKKDDLDDLDDDTPTKTDKKEVDKGSENDDLDDLSLDDLDD